MRSARALLGHTAADLEWDLCLLTPVRRADPSSMLKVMAEPHRSRSMSQSAADSVKSETHTPDTVFCAEAWCAGHTALSQAHCLLRNGKLLPVLGRQEHLPHKWSFASLCSCLDKSLKEPSSRPCMG